MKATNRQLFLTAVIFLLVTLDVFVAQNQQTAPNGSPATQGVGLIRNEPGAFKGYTLISPLQSTSTFLIDMEGRVVKTWETDSTPSSIAYLLESGNLIRAGLAANPPFGRTAGGGGKMQEFNWNGELVWDFAYGTAIATQHHDFTRLPNGNVLLVVKEKKTADQAIAAGRIPSTVQGTDVQPDSLIEIKPSGKTGGEVVWEWHLWDHLIQDFDRDKGNYGEVAAHPERVDINYNVREGQRGNSDWTHFNAVAYNADLDQVLVSLRNFSEIWILDHSTTTSQAAGRTGGHNGKGGDLLYRWGNPRVYRAGTAADQRLYGQHNAHWIPKGLGGAGPLLIFNNGDTRPGSMYSTIEEVVLPVDSNGRYSLGTDMKYGPERAVWTYTAEKPTDFYSVNISGAQRLPNGNTLICAGAPGFIFEVTSQNKIVWQYNLPAFGARGGPNARNVFRAYRFGPDFPGLSGKQLVAGKTLEESAK
jgi:Arylsulfotransferase (ASST)